MSAKRGARARGFRDAFVSDKMGQFKFDGLCPTMMSERLRRFVGSGRRTERKSNEQAIREAERGDEEAGNET
jgi:hypothetical protein